VGADDPWTMLSFAGGRSGIAAGGHTSCEGESEVMARPVGPGIDTARRALGAKSATR